MSQSVSYVKDYITYKKTCSFFFFAEAEISVPGQVGSWGLVAIYASTKEAIIRQQWEVPTHVIQDYQRVMVLGDFNDILETHEKGGNVRSLASMVDFDNFVQTNELFDLGYVGNNFTWRR